MTSRSTEVPAQVTALTPEAQAFFDQWIQAVRGNVRTVASPAKLPIIEALANAADAVQTGDQLGMLRELKGAFDAVIALDVAGPALRLDSLPDQLKAAVPAGDIQAAASSDLDGGTVDPNADLPDTAALKARAMPAAEMRERVVAGTQPTTIYGVPRGCNLLGMSREEFILRDALLAIEAVGTSPLLTDAAMLLDWARDTLGRWIDRGDEGQRVQYVEMITDHDPGTVPPDEQATEDEIAACGADKFPRVSTDQLTALVASVSYLHLPGTSMTIAILTTVDGFRTVGHSASASIENFNPVIGRDLAFRAAREKLWALEGYALRKKLAAAERNVALKEKEVEAQAFADANPEFFKHFAQGSTPGTWVRRDDDATTGVDLTGGMG